MKGEVMIRRPSLGLVIVAMACTVAAAVACGDDDDTDDTPTSVPTAGATATAPAQATVEPTDPCTTRTGVGGETLVAGESFEAEGQDVWQVCVGGVAAGSSEKLLFRSTDAGATWMLISRTTLGNPPPEAGVGEFPNQGSVAVIVFISEDTGWIGLESAGQNLYRSQDGGSTWEAAEELPPAVPVTAIDFSDPPNGTVTTADSTWTTTDSGDTWVESP
jgi:photosystem II stability/assembly factor-like uncharacterized protein